MNLQDAISEAARRAFTALRETYPADDFYYWALITTGDGMRPAPSAASRQGLERVLSEYRARGWEAAPAELRWSEADSPYHLFGDGYFAGVEQLFQSRGDHHALPADEYYAEVAERFAAMEGALRDLDAAGFFGSGPDRERVVINVVAPGAESEEVLMERAARLNPPASLIQLRQDWDMNLNCPDCGAALQHFRSGASLIVRCPSPSCSWEAVTTFPVPILRDHARYSLIIPALPDVAPAMLMVLNRRFTHGLPVTRRLAICGQLPPFDGGAVEVWHEAQRLRSAGIPFQIEPGYPYDLEAPVTAFGPPDGLLPDEPVA